MNADLSVAPEIAQFAQRAPVDPPAAPRGTLGDHADELITLAVTPQRWWDRVRFDPAGPVRIPLTTTTWLLVLPPGHASECDCQLGTLVAGEAAEGDRPLRPGRTAVHGSRTGRHLIRSTAAGYAVSLHTSVKSGGLFGNHPAG